MIKRESGWVFVRGEIYDKRIHCHSIGRGNFPLCLFILLPLKMVTVVMAITTSK